jgi:hypothetical protein
MGIKTPVTYSDWYWKNYVEAISAADEDLEIVLSEQARSLISGLAISENLPDWVKPLFTKMQEPTSAGYGGVLGRFVSEAADGILGNTMNHALKDFNYTMAGWFKDERIDFLTAMILYQRKKIDETFYLQRMGDNGFKEYEGLFRYKASMPYPTIPDLVLYARYHGDPENTRGVVWDYFDVDPDDYPLWEWLALQRLTTDDVTLLYRRGVIDEARADDYLLRIGWSAYELDLVKEIDWQIPNAMLVVQGELQQGKEYEAIIKDILFADIHPQYAQTYLDAVLTKPSSGDIIAYTLRTDPELFGLEDKLKKIGIHPDWVDTYKTLAFPIPPVADLITMAVREAFSPEIAARFGQYEDFPPDFEYWAVRKGLTKDWASRYWASHWSLPSPTQAFDMLHRGVINTEELNLLLRALDIMPFWRDRLTAIAYRPLTRVDIRRMYELGIFEEGDVYTAYRKLGYNDEDAKSMSEFTVKQTLSKQSKFTATDIVSAFSKFMVSRTEASSLLSTIGVKRENIDFILTTAEYKRQWELTDTRIDAIRNLYKKGVYSKDTAEAELLKLNIPTAQVTNLMNTWYFEAEAEAPKLWTTAQTLSFYKKQLISRSRAETELRLIGYDTERLQLLLATV